MARRGFTQTQVDDMELWVIEAVLSDGASDANDMTAEDPTGEGVPMTAEDFQRQSMALIQQRLAAVASSPDEAETPTIAP